MRNNPQKSRENEKEKATRESKNAHFSAWLSIKNTNTLPSPQRTIDMKKYE